MSSEVPNGWRRGILREVLCEQSNRCGHRTDLPALSLTKSNGLILARERFGRALYGKDISRYRHVRRGELVVDPMLLWDGVISRLLRFEEGFVSPDYRVYKANKGIEVRFLDFLLQGHHMRLAFKNNARGTNKRRNRIARDDFLGIDFLEPPHPEQKKIAAILSSVDEAIQAKRAALKQIGRVKEGIVQDLLTRGIGHTHYKKTPVGDRPASWPVVRLGDVVRKVSLPVNVQKETTYREIGVRSHGKGLFYKEPVAGAVLGSKRVFWVQPNVLVVNIVFAWERAIGVTSDHDEGLIASHRFPMFEPTERASLTFLAHYLLTDPANREVQLASPGGAGRNRTLNQTAFLRVPVPLPSIDEQQAIVNAIAKVESSLKAQAAELMSLEDVKAGLLQDLLTGKVRVTV